jgi:hypothetical protein
VARFKLNKFLLVLRQRKTQYFAAASPPCQLSVYNVRCPLPPPAHPNSRSRQLLLYMSFQCRLCIKIFLKLVDDTAAKKYLNHIQS